VIDVCRTCDWSRTDGGGGICGVGSQRGMGSLSTWKRGGERKIIDFWRTSDNGTHVQSIGLDV
jgi:hypothetical protein